MLFRGQNPLTSILKKERCSFRQAPPHFYSPIPPKREYPVRGKVFRCASSLTVECALILPLFLMGVLTMLSAIDLVGELTARNLALSNEARKIALYDAAAGDSAPEWVDLTAAVTPRISFSALPVRLVRADARARVRSYIGFESSDFASSGEENVSGDTVYVSDYESVYHTHPDCTHLDLTVFETDTGSVGSLRNAYGKRYKPCDGFPSGYTGKVYVTAKGDYYYPSPDRGPLTRHVHVVSPDDVPDLCICSRCRERDHAA